MTGNPYAGQEHLLFGRDQMARMDMDVGAEKHLAAILRVAPNGFYSAKFINRRGVEGPGFPYRDGTLFDDP